jgi:hypothetical protein
MIILRLPCAGDARVGTARGFGVCAGSTMGHRPLTTILRFPALYLPSDYLLPWDSVLKILVSLIPRDRVRLSRCRRDVECSGASGR